MQPNIINMKINKKGLEMIKEFESLRLKSYLDTGGVWTIGYGSTGADIGENLVWTEAQAEDRFCRDLSKFERGVSDLIKININENQFSALVSFAYNVGLSALQKSTLLKKLNSGDFDGAAKEFLRWNKDNGKVIKGLTRRREAEKTLFEEQPCQQTTTATSGDILTLTEIQTEIKPTPQSQSQKTIFANIIIALKKFLGLD